MPFSAWQYTIDKTGQPAASTVRLTIGDSRAIGSIKEYEKVYNEWAKYVPVAKRIARGAAFAKRRAKKLKRDVQPVVARRKITTTFWGDAWCNHIEGLSDFANRLPRGKTYARNGSIADLDIGSGVITAIVSGTDVYEIEITIDPITSAHWQDIVQRCGQSIDSLLDLLSGTLSDGTMRILTQPVGGLMPTLGQFHTDCDCPDWADLCKHLAAVLYGVGVRLDTSPELLFLLRGVDPSDLVTASTTESLDQLATESTLEGSLSDIFGVDVDTIDPPSSRDEKKPNKKTTTKSPRQKSGRRMAGTRRKSATANSATPRPRSTKKKTDVNKKTSAKKAVVSKTDKPKKKTRKAKKKTIGTKRKSAALGKSPKKTI